MADEKTANQAYRHRVVDGSIPSLGTYIFINDKLLVTLTSIKRGESIKKYFFENKERSS
jgi:hypothetical protein